MPANGVLYHRFSAFHPKAENHLDGIPLSGRKRKTCLGGFRFRPESGILCGQILLSGQEHDSPLEHCSAFMLKPLFHYRGIPLSGQKRKTSLDGIPLSTRKRKCWPCFSAFGSKAEIYRPVLYHLNACPRTRVSMECCFWGKSGIPCALNSAFGLKAEKLSG